MRRIIERVVTVVTTTTWTISWQGDPPHASRDPQAGPIADDLLKPDTPHETAKHIQQFSSMITTKEAEPVETKTETDLKADEPPLDPNSNQSKIERKRKP